VDASGFVYVTDTANNLIRKISPQGMVTTLAGVAGIAGSRDGPGEQALFNGPTGLAVQDVANSAARLFVADTANSTIRQVEANGNVTTYAGVPTVAGMREGTG